MCNEPKKVYFFSIARIVLQTATRGGRQTIDSRTSVASVTLGVGTKRNKATLLSRCVSGHSGSRKTVAVPGSMIVHLVSMAVLGLHLVEGRVWEDFHRDSDLNDMVFTDDLIFETAARSKLDCSRQCSSRICCVVFTFTTMTSGGSCRGHSSAMTSQSDHVTTSKARSYIRDKAGG